MFLTNWLAGRDVAVPGRKPTTRLRIESLEGRASPAYLPFTWTNQTGNGDWGNANNWLQNQTPGIFDDMIFPANRAGVVITNGLDFGTMTILGGGYFFNPGDGINIDFSMTATFKAGQVSTFNSDIDFHDYNDTFEVFVTNPGSRLQFNGDFINLVEELTFNGAGDVTVSGNILENGSQDLTDVIKDGTGTLTFNSTTSNVYQARTAVRDGTLRLDATPGTNAVPFLLQIGNELGEIGSAIVDQLKSNQIENTAYVDMRGDGLWRLDSATLSESVGGLTSNSLSSQVELGASKLDLQPITFPATFEGSINGTSGAITVSAGDQTFAGPITLTGTGPALTVRGGATMEVTNVVAGQRTIVTDAAGIENLYASSTSGGITVSANDNFHVKIRDAEQNEFAASPTTGTLNLAATSKSFYLLNSANDFSSVAVTSKVVSLGFLDVELGGIYVPSVGESFTIVDNAGSSPVGSTYNGLPEGAIFTDSAGLTTFKITYVGGDGNDVVITNTASQSVTINQASFQPDPTTGPTATFDAVFTGAVRSFDSSRVIVNTSGSLAYTALNVTQRSPSEFRVVVAGLTGTGTVTVSLAAGAGISFADAPSRPSTSTDNSVTRVGQRDFPSLSPTGGNPIPPGSSTSTLVGSDVGQGGRANIYRGNTSDFSTIIVSGNDFAAGGVRVATADFNLDGIVDYVFGAGPGGQSVVRIVDGRTGSTLLDTIVFENSYTGGIYVAAGDLTGDGLPDLAVTPDQGGGGRVIVFSGAGFNRIADFYGIDDLNFRGGARPAIGDVNGDGIGDLIISAGFGGGPRIAGFSGSTLASGDPQRLFADFYAFESTLLNGAFVAVGDVNGDGLDDIIAGGGPGGSPRVTVFDAAALLSSNQAVPIADFFAGNQSDRGGVRIAVEDFNGDGTDDLMTGAGVNSGTGVKVYPLPTLLGTATPPLLTAFDAFPDLPGGVFVG